jgi:hypothetical protein
VLKVLAAELTDAQRLRRGKQLHADDAVVDIVVGHGITTAEVQGSRREPYVVTLEAAPGPGVPTRRDLVVRCTCPDDDGSGRSGCKHVVAALLALADEIAVEPDLVVRWRGGSVRPSAAPSSSSPSQPSLATVWPDGLPGRPFRPVEPPDGLAPLFEHPAGTSMPLMPQVEPIPTAPPPDRLLADVLADALDHVRPRWW